MSSIHTECLRCPIFSWASLLNSDGLPVDRPHFSQPCLHGARIWPGVGLFTGDFLRSQRGGDILPGFYSRTGGLGLLPGAWSAPNKGNADEAEGIFGNTGHVWATALRLDPHEKPLCCTCPVVGRRTNTQVLRVWYCVTARFTFCLPAGC